MTDTLIPVSHTETALLPSADTVQFLRHVRLYPSSPEFAKLQIRTEGKTSDHGTAIRKAFSTASLDLEAARKLHDALGEWIADQVVNAHQ